MKVKSLSCVRLFATPWTVADQASLSMGFSRQGYWSGLPFPSPRDLPNPGIELRPPALSADALLSEPSGKLYMYVWLQFSLLDKVSMKIYIQWNKLFSRKMAKNNFSYDGNNVLSSCIFCLWFRVKVHQFWKFLIL